MGEARYVVFRVRCKKKAENRQKTTNEGLLDLENHVKTGIVKDIPDMLGHVDQL